MPSAVSTAQLGDGLVDRLGPAMGSWRLQLEREIRQRRGAVRLLGGELRDDAGRAIPHDAPVAAGEELPDDLRADTPEIDDSDFHDSLPRGAHASSCDSQPAASRRYGGEKYCTGPSRRSAPANMSISERHRSSPTIAMRSMSAPCRT